MHISGAINAAFGIILVLSSAALAGGADVEKVDIRKTADRVYTFSVTVRHADTGWDHYANKWDVVGPDGTAYGVRVLHHPHENEQPFTRSLGGIEIPENVKAVTVRAHDSVHGAAGKTMDVKVPD